MFISYVSVHEREREREYVCVCEYIHRHIYTGIHMHIQSIRAGVVVEDRSLLHG